MSKKVKQKNPWTNIVRKVEMGDEIRQQDMQPNMVYSVLMISKGETSQIWKWGIIITKQDGSIVRNFNINVDGDWDSNNVRMRSTWKLFNADPYTQYFADMYRSVITMTKEIRTLNTYINAHWWRRI